MTETLSLRAKIEQSPMGAYQWMIVVMAAIMNLLDGFDVLALAFTATAIRGEFGLTGIELGYLLSAVSLSAIGMLGSAFISQYQWLGFWRVITGLGVGGILVGTNVITSEYSSRKWRSFAISVYAAGFGIGAVLGGMFAVMLQGEYGWRSVFLAGAILTGLLLVVLFIWLPESIDFLTTPKCRSAVKFNRKKNWFSR